MNAIVTAAEVDVSVFEAINQRRSVRSYKPAVIDAAAIDTLLRAAVRAPTATHAEPCAFAIVQDAVILRRLSDLTKEFLITRAAHHATDRGGQLPEMFLRPGFSVFHDAGTLVAICALTPSEFVVADCWLAAENLVLAAHAMGLGTCIIGSALGALNLTEGKKALGIPDEYHVLAPIVVGVPRDGGMPTPRKDPKVLAWMR